MDKNFWVVDFQKAMVVADTLTKKFNKKFNVIFSKSEKSWIVKDDQGFRYFPPKKTIDKDKTKS